MALIPKRDSASAADRKAKAQAAQDEALLREVDDAVRSDQYLGIWHNYGRYIIGAVVLALVAFAAVVFFNHRSEGEREADSEVLVTALDQLEAGNLAEADKRLAAVDPEDTGGAPAQAQMLRAGIALEQGKTKEAAALFEKVAANEDVAEPIRKLALLRAVVTSYDTMKPAEVIERLTPLAQPGEPYFGSAGEVLGMAYLDAGQKDKAAALFAKIAKDKDVADTIRGRARQMASVLGVDAVGDVDELIEDLQASRGARAPGQPSQ